MQAHGRAKMTFLPRFHTTKSWTFESLKPPCRSDRLLIATDLKCPERPFSLSKNECHLEKHTIPEGSTPSGRWGCPESPTQLLYCREAEAKAKRYITKSSTTECASVLWKGGHPFLAGTGVQSNSCNETNASVLSLLEIRAVYLDRCLGSLSFAAAAVKVDAAMEYIWGCAVSPGDVL